MWLLRRDIVRLTEVGFATDLQNSLAGGVDDTGVICRQCVFRRQTSMRPQGKRFAVFEVGHLCEQFIAQARRLRRREHRFWLCWPMDGTVSRALSSMGAGRRVDGGRGLYENI